MPRRIMLEAVQPVVDGNTVVVAPGDLFEPGSVPEGVQVREVIADAPEPPKAPPPPAADKPAGKK